MTPKERISSILERWFITEPALFQVMCTHQAKANTAIACPLRSGQRRLEFNPAFIEQMTDRGLEEAMKAEAVRILLKHPYERKPEGCSLQAISIGSTLVIGDNYPATSLRVSAPKDYDLPSGREYEWYAMTLQDKIGAEAGGASGQDEGNADSTSSGNPSSDKDKDYRFSESAESDSDHAALWEEDELTVQMINGIIRNCNSWGSVPGNLVELIKASTVSKINWRNILGGFRSSILSSKRRLTRMRPNRRTGFQNMGSTRRFTTKILVAVDVSGSVTSGTLSRFYGIVNSAFRYGIERIDVLQFDYGVRGVVSIERAIKDIPVLGRGGTSFTEPIRYAHDKGYDGMLILTDGYAPPPSVPDGMTCKIMWVCEDRESYETHHSWMEKYGRVCTMPL
ncbi:MAG: hypothetical protein IJ202_07855 [Bacteroidales bacterium]|nr:hypothetical protein [Bacteroidales bacterium]